MKKILSLLMATWLVMGIFAAPSYLRQANRMPVKDRGAKLIAKKTITKTPARVMETISLAGMDAIDFYFYSSYSEDGAWNYSVDCYNATDEYPYLMLDVYTPVKGQLEGTYSMSAGNVGKYTIVYLSDSESAEFKDADFTISKSGDNYIVAGQAKDSVGNVYTFTVTAPATMSDGEYPYEPMEAQGTKALTIASLSVNKDYLSDYGEAYYDFTTNDGNVVELDWYTEGSVIPRDGVYSIDTTAEAFYVGYYDPDYGTAGSYYHAKNEGEVYYLVDGVVTIETKNNATTYTVDATSVHGTKIQFSYTTPGGVTPTPVDGATIVIAEYEAASFTTKDGVYTISTTRGTQEDAKYNPNQSDLRVYGGGTLNIASTDTMKTIIFTLSAKGKERQATITPSTGAMSYDVNGTGTVTWSGEAMSVTFTVGANATYGSDGASKAGQFDFTAITISTKGGVLPPTPITGTEIKGLLFAEAIYYEEDGEHYWDFDLYKAFSEESGYTYPELYLMEGNTANSKTSIVGDYSLGYAGYYRSAIDSVETDGYNPVGSVSISYISGNNYRFKGSFVGTDEKTYTFDATVSVKAYDWDNDTEIVLNEGGVVPPTPVNVISVSKALEIGNALANGATTDETYTVEGWAIKLYGTYNTQYKSQSWYMADDKTETYGQFEAFQCYPDREVAVGDYMIVTGQITKYVSNKNVVTIEIKNGQAHHAHATSLEKTATMTHPVKVVKNGKIFIQRDEEVFTVMGNRVK